MAGIWMDGGGGPPAGSAGAALVGAASIRTSIRLASGSQTLPSNPPSFFFLVIGFAPFLDVVFPWPSPSRSEQALGFFHRCHHCSMFLLNVKGMRSGFYGCCKVVIASVSACPEHVLSPRRACRGNAISTCALGIATAQTARLAMTELTGSACQGTMQQP